MDEFTKNAFTATADRVIPADQAFTPTQPIKLPETETFRSPADDADLELQFSPLVKESQEREKASQKERDTSLQNISEVFRRQADLPQQGIQMAEEAGIPEMQSGLAELDSLMAMKSQGLRRELQTLEGQNVPVSFIRGQQNRLNIQATRELADLAVVRNSQLGRLEAAENWVQRKVEAETESLRSQLAYQSFVYQENKEVLTKEQDKQFQLNLMVTQEKYNRAKETRQQVNNMALQAAQFGAGLEAVTAIGNAETFEQALGQAAEYLGKPFALQIENQQFQQWATKQQISQGWQSLALQEQQRDISATQAQLAMSKEAKDELTKTQAYQNWEMRGLIANDLDNTLSEFAGTAERDNIQWEALAKNDSAVNAIATQLVYSRNPQLRRASELGDATATADIKAQVIATVEKLRVGRNIQPDLLKDRVREIDTNYRSAVEAKNNVVNDILLRNPNAILPEYNLADIQAGTATKILDAELESSFSGLDALFNRQTITPFNKQ